MALRKWAYIFLSPGFNKEEHKATLSSSTCQFVTVGIDFKDKEQVVDIARQLVADGVQMIELCGGFGPLWIARVSEAINGAVPVGSTAYGPEARQPMLDLLSAAD